MESGMKLLVLGLCLLTVQSYGYEERDYRRALELLDKLRNVVSDGKRGAFDCKKLGEACDGVIPCCGERQCYWEEGYSVLKKGECVKCVSSGLKCQRDSQCCNHLQCDKGNSMWTDGTCEKYRRSGSCYRDGQCVKDCVKSWYETHGTCS